MNKRLIILFVTLPILFHSGFGQSTCPDLSDAEWLRNFQASLDSMPDTIGPTQYFPLQLHIVGENDGTDYAQIDNIFSALKTVNEDYRPAGIQFYLAEDINFIDNDTLHTHFQGVPRGFFARYHRDSMINCYIVNVASGTTGYSVIAPDNKRYLVLPAAALVPETRIWSHEIGHLFNLPHTFLGWNTDTPLPRSSPAPDSVFFRVVERVDGSNCREASDGFCDTPPDYISYYWGCDANGNFPDTLIDPVGVRFAVSGNNIMNRAEDGCRGAFSEEQSLAVYHFGLQRNDLSLGTAPSDTVPQGSSIEAVYPGPDSTIAPAQEITFSWSAIAGAERYVVELNTSPNFAGPSLEYFIAEGASFTFASEYFEEERRLYWRVMPITSASFCNAYSPAFRFRLRRPVSTPAYRQALPLRIFPNPVQQDRLYFQGQGFNPNDNLSLDLIDGKGRIVMQQKDRAENLFASGIKTESLSAGVYMLRISGNEKRWIGRVMVID